MIHWIDVTIVIAYLVALSGVGVYFSRRQTSIDEFFRAKRSMTWLPVGLSLMAALNSGIDYLMQPSAAIRYGLVLLVGISSWVIMYPWVSRVTLPFYRRLDLYTVYEYLEARFDVRVRTLAALIFVLWRLGWMATALYVPCLAINAATSGRLDLTIMIVVLGVIVTLYTALGGIQAVVWNDVVQFCVMFGGLAATVAIAFAHLPAGMSDIVSAAREAGRPAGAAVASSGSGAIASIAAFFREPINATAVFVAYVFGRMATYTTDQVMVQRFQTARSLRDSTSAYVVNAVSDAVWTAGLTFVGLALFAYFRERPLSIELGSDRILPYFIAQTFPAGAVGLVIAAILAASLSSIDSAINSCTSVVMVDVYGRFVRGRLSSRAGAHDHDAARDVRLSRWVTFAVGACGTALATSVARIGSLLEIANKLINAFQGPLFGLYLLAMFSRRATPGPVLAAGLAGSLTSYWVAYHSSIGFMWPSTFGLFVTVGVGQALAWATRARPTAAAAALTWRRVMASPAPAIT